MERPPAHGGTISRKDFLDSANSEKAILQSRPFGLAIEPKRLPLAEVAGYAERSEPNSFGTGERDEKGPFCSRCRGHNRCGNRMDNKLCPTEQEGDCRVNPGRSTVVYTALLQRRQTASATVWRLRQRRHLDRSSENTWRCACARAYAPARRTSYGDRRHLVSGRGSEIRLSEAKRLPGG